uniref:LamG-like jellyroll fold domain-containing protein n=1 Tax=Eucampia antarctica TaxID=49252 RepID=A0A6U0RR20_9STRA|mmetsp:Transcript_22353/g.21482  ORF Transcript_22353/g.21482 Transcript_22353/m.21482 type:complete len:271 (+) Transcript_22353:79-891(+)
MNIYNNILFFLFASLRAKETDAVEISGLLRLYRGEGNLDDSIGNYDMTGTPTGISFPLLHEPYPSGKARQVAKFTAEGRGFASATGLPEGNAARTIVGWFKQSCVSLPAVSQRPFGYGSTGTESCGEAFYIQNDFPFSDNFGILAYGYADSCFYSIFIAECDTWYHIAVAFDGTGTYDYVNGEMIDTIVQPSTLTTKTNVGDGASAAMPMTLGYEGYVADFGIFNRVLSTTEVERIYNAPDGLQYIDPTTVPSQSPSINSITQPEVGPCS